MQPPGGARGLPFCACQSVYSEFIDEGWSESLQLLRNNAVILVTDPVLDSTTRFRTCVQRSQLSPLG